MRKPDFADYKYTVKEGSPSASGIDDAPTSLMCEPMSSELSTVGDKGFLSLNLAEGVKVDEAQQIARLLNDKVIGISYTKL